MSNQIDPADLVRFRNHFYRDKYRSTMTVLLVSILLNAACCVAVFYLWQYRPLPKYFATSAEGRILKLVPLNEPLHSNEDIISWASSAAIAAMSYNFLEYKTQLQKAGQYFTDKAFNDYLRSLRDSGNIDLLTQKRLIARPYLEGPPVLDAVGNLSRSEGYAKVWRVRLPIATEFVSSSEKIVVHYEVTALVRRVSTLETPKGIKLDSFVINTKRREAPQRIR